jgi:hypothetical protein
MDDFPYGAAVFLSDAEFSRYAASLRRRGGSPSGGIKLAPKTGQLVPRKGKVVGYGKWVKPNGEPTVYVQVKWVGDRVKVAGLYPPSELRLANERRAKNPSADWGDMQIRTLERALAADPSDDQARHALLAARARLGDPMALARLSAVDQLGQDAAEEDIIQATAWAIRTMTAAAWRRVPLKTQVKIAQAIIDQEFRRAGLTDAPIPQVRRVPGRGLRVEDPRFEHGFTAYWGRAETPASMAETARYWARSAVTERRAARNPRRHPNYTPVDPHDPAALIDLALSYVEKPRPNVAKAREAMEAVYGAHPDLEEVARSWVARAQQGEPRAVIVLGWLAEFEIGFDLESADADELFDRAIELGWPWATTSLLN